MNPFASSTVFMITDVSAKPKRVLDSFNTAIDSFPPRGEGRVWVDRKVKTVFDGSATSASDTFERPEFIATVVFIPSEDLSGDEKISRFFTNG
jgi:hypothetical protein